MIESENTSSQDQCRQIIQHLFEEQSSLATIAIDGHHIQLSQLDEPIFASALADSGKADNMTRRQLFQYYTLVAPNMLPLLRGRPITVKRFPNGLTGGASTERHFPMLPDYVETIEMYSEYTGDNEQFMLCQNLATLLWLIDKQAIEIYPWQSTIEADATGLPTIFINSSGTLDMSVVNYPDLMAFNLSLSHTATQQDLSTTTEKFDVTDAANSQSIEAAWGRVKEAAFLLQEYLSVLGIDTSYVKTSGRGGLHIIVPIQRQHTYDYVKTTAQRIGQQLVAQQPDLLTMDWQLNDREGKVFVDCSQNVRNKSIIAAYCPRPNRQAAISMPVSWKELEGLEPLTYSIGYFLEKISDGESSDTPIKPPRSWQNIFKHSQTLPEILM